ncbi:hypothetical protein OG594_37855 [Streptomyces sp. NBC_01214]|uniref:hypothetical protein n=1 Tax=Streptomyces sp. NBC_01214 TaxID=2903777 RepID=UPI0022562B01|nr:hypothetical protein [Streptomyces sp. NBC_01214]MCX4807316.1 hypothetical protein [Streptomyces sp. NBC_01214]
MRLDRADDVDQVGERPTELMARGPEHQFIGALLALPVDQRARLPDRMATVSGRPAARASAARRCLGAL